MSDQRTCIKCGQPDSVGPLGEPLLRRDIDICVDNHSCKLFAKREWSPESKARKEEQTRKESYITLHEEALSRALSELDDLRKEVVILRLTNEGWKKSAEAYEESARCFKMALKEFSSL